MLIVGGLIAVGVVALILAFAVVRLDRPDATAPRAIATSADSPAEANSTASTLRSESPRTPTTSGSLRSPKATVQLDGQFLEDEQSTFASGQFQEIFGQLRLLLRQMQGIEQRLDTLTIMVEQLAEQQEGREEQESAQSSVSTLAHTPRPLKE
ncbi:MAG: hypothetical protein IMW89_22495 [Ktedonobacteraceae bacterium]|nr:hypothetical protein [Ktedonobacteraceae bacterium]